MSLFRTYDADQFRLVEVALIRLPFHISEKYCSKIIYLAIAFTKLRRRRRCLSFFIFMPVDIPSKVHIYREICY